MSRSNRPSRHQPAIENHQSPTSAIYCSVMPRLFVCAAILFASLRLLNAADGAALYKEICATCHDGGTDRAPNREVLRGMSAERVLDALETGAMVSKASRRSGQERRA